MSTSAPTVLVGLARPAPAPGRADRSLRVRPDGWAAGLLDEVARPRRGPGLREGRTAAKASATARRWPTSMGRMGARGGGRGPPSRRTRRFAGRQEKWFRADPRVHWLAYDDPRRRTCSSAALVERVASST